MLFGGDNGDGLSATAPVVETVTGVSAIEPALPLDIQREIGRGAMGIVYLAWDRVLARSVALKKMRADLLDHPDAVHRFYHEARAAARLNHPNIITIHGMGRIGDEHGFTMPVAVGNLDQRRDHFADARAAATLLTKIARAVHAAHQHGLVHRDLKPANILLNDRDEPLVADFGLAVLLTEVRPAIEGRQVVGTPHYMAPEQFGEFGGRISEATDVWALGVILYELLAGTRPFKAKSMARLQTAIQRDEPPALVSKLRGVDGGLEAIVRRCLEKNPQQRYASAEAVAVDLENWLEGKPLQAKPDDWLKRRWRAIRRWPALATAAALLLAFGTFLALWLAFAPAPVPENPDVMALRSINKRLKDGETVEFVSPEGDLLRHQWVLESGGVDRNEKKQGVDVHSQRMGALMELLPVVPLDRYLIIAEYRVWWTIYGKGGIYCLHNIQDVNNKPAHSFLSLSLAEDGKLAGRVWAEFQYEDGIPSTHQEASDNFKKQADQYHTLEVEVTPEKVRLSHNGKVFRTIVPDKMVAAAQQLAQGRQFGNGEPSVAKFQPAGGVGVYVFNCQTTFRSLRIKPLP